MWCCIRVTDPRAIRYEVRPHQSAQPIRSLTHVPPPTPQQLWVYDVESSQLRHGSSDKCLAINDAKKKIIMEDCNRSKEPQRWRMENYDASKY